ncbi:hypothetical protein KUCAC02_031423 [Chaenocephalus aceratus]|nr:hypothetical protein KUCAC02_031423 [Chaenocephalus aceratus]
MAAYDILRRKKKSIEENFVNRYKVIHVSVGMLVDMIMDKGMENCQLFLDLLQTDEAIQKTFPKLTNILENILEDGQYVLKSQPTGLCLIINNKHFSDGNVRRGTDKDAERLGEVFSWLGFRGADVYRPDQEPDGASAGMLCFSVGAFLSCRSHGDKGVVLGVDGEPLRIKKITRTFMATPQSPLSAKPKVFLIQACQGGLEADFLVHSSTVQDCYANRDPMKGSVFIQSVCNQLEEGCPRNEEIEVILRRVNKEVAAKERRLVLTPHLN